MLIRVFRRRMHRKRFLRPLVALLVPALLLSWYALSIRSGRAQADAQTPSAAEAAEVNAVLPGSSASFAHDRTGGLSLLISVPAASAELPGAALAAPSPPTAAESRGITFGELGWRAGIAAGVAGADNSAITSYSVSEQGVTPTSAEQNYLSSAIRSQAGQAEFGELPQIGSASPAIINSQLQSNLDTLRNAVPRGTIMAAQTQMIPIAPSRGDYALEINLKVQDLASIAPYEADFVDGLATGLVGSDDALVDGLALNIVDASGRRAGWWCAGRAGLGMGYSDPALAIQGGEETTTFQNLTGGPNVTGSASGTASASPGASARKSPRAYEIAPTRGIGPVSIGARQTSVEAALHHPTEICRQHCLRIYKSRRGDLSVSYLNGRVNGIASRSSKLLLEGQPLSLGPKRLKRALRKWRFVACAGYEYGAGPSTLIAFGRHGTVDVNVLAGRIGGCGAQ